MTPQAFEIKFVPPDDDNIETAKIYTSPDKTGPWTISHVIETDEIGVYPDYIDKYTIISEPGLWVTVSFVTGTGVESPKANPLLLGTDTVIGELIDRILRRDSTLNENVVKEVAEATLEKFFNKDPYEVMPAQLTYKRYYGLTMLALASIYRIRENTSTQPTSWTAGLVSLNTAKGGSPGADIEALEKEAAKWLGLSGSRIAQMAKVEIASGLSEIVCRDLSRLMIEVE